MTESNQHFINKSFRNYLIPSILSILGGSISIMIDNCVAGAVLGEKALAAMSIVSPVFSVIISFGLLISGGASMLASISIGSNDTAKKNVYFTLAFYLTLIVGVLITIIGLATLNPIILALGATGELFELSRDYCLVMILGSVAIMGVYLPLNFFRIEGMGRMGMLMFLIMSVLDIVFDLVFVAVFSWGMTGLALATILSAIIALAVVSPILPSRRLGYRLVRPEHPMADIKRILYRGSPLAMGDLYSVIRVRIINGVFLACGGSLALAAYTCANNVGIIGLAFISGISQTVVSLVGVLYGERDGNGIKSVAAKASKTGLIATICFGGISILLSQPIALLFGMNTPEQIKMVQMAISILSVNLVFEMLSNVLIYSYLACNRTGLANLLTFTKGLGFAVLFTILGAQLFGSTGALLGTVAAGVATILLALAINVFKRKKDPDFKGILLLSHKTFWEGHSIAYSVQNTSDSITQASSQCGEFCEAHELSAKQAMTVSLGVEEIMILLSKYALSQPKDLIEVRLFISPLETVMRFRCDGKWFNPLSFKADEEFDNVGIKLLLRLAKEISYSTNLGMNNIQIVI